MIAYLDSSVLLRIALDQPGRLPARPRRSHEVTSALALAECRRAIDRMRLATPMPDEEVAQRLEVVHALFERVDVVELTPEILDRAGDPFPTALGTLDAIHLSTALLWQQSESAAFDAFLTHDVELGRAARAMAFHVVGC